MPELPLYKGNITIDGEVLVKKGKWQLPAVPRMWTDGHSQVLFIDQETKKCSLLWLVGVFIGKDVSGFRLEYFDGKGFSDDLGSFVYNSKTNKAGFIQW
jgi:hypothetical protein